MSILTIAWSMAAAICLTFAALNIYIWSKKRHDISYLLFSIAAIGAFGNAVVELWMSKAVTIETFRLAVKMQHIPVFLLVISLVWFVYVYFNTARRWLGLVITFLWLLALIINFASPYSLVYTNISEIKQIPLPWGEEYTVALGSTNSWKFLADSASLLFIIFILDATIRFWRQGERGKSISVGGSIVFFIIVAGLHSPLVDAGILHTPYLISFFFLAIILVAGFQLSNDVVLASELSEDIKINERRWRTLLESVQLIVIGLDEMGRINYVNPFFLKLAGYQKEDVIDQIFTNIIPEKYRNGVQTVFKTFINKNTKPYHQNPIITKAGEELLIDWSNVGLYDREGQFIGTLSIGVDITERERAIEEIEQLKNRLQEENIYLQEEIVLDYNYRDIIGKSDVLKYVLTRINQVAKTDTIVLIEGETGVGKELVARAIHHNSIRKDRPLVKINCAVIPVNLLESELFGHVKGAFTGADKDRKGRFELADGGTLFLDEIGELPLELQSKLLRVLDEGEFEKLGSNKTIKFDVRVIVATNRNLKEEVSKGQFREDLFYRINTYPISIPPLRKRKDDIPLLVETFVDYFSRKLGKKINKIPKNTLDMLLNYTWPGNIRELKNVIEQAVIISKGDKLHITEKLISEKIELKKNADNDIISLEEMERQHIVNALQQTNGKISGEKGAAVLLGLHPNTLRFRMQKLGIRK
jgi:PAS domain S-box-containing protein